MLYTLKDILQIAEQKKIAIGAFNTCNLPSLHAIIAAAEETQQPIILQFAQRHEACFPLADMGPLMVRHAQEASIPICVHLDHGENLDYLHQALTYGFTSIMFDGSTLPYERNVALTTEAATMAHAFGASCEAELGSMGRLETGSGSAVDASGDDDTKVYTDPDQAAAFVAATRIDALACSFGTTHGIYLKAPRLDFSIVERVRAATGGIPVVMHGGSGISREDFRQAIRAGVRKINYFTYMDKAGAQAVIDLLQRGKLSHPLFSDMVTAAQPAMQRNVADTIRVFSETDM